MNMRKMHYFYLGNPNGDKIFNINNRQTEIFKSGCSLYKFELDKDNENIAYFSLVEDQPSVCQMISKDWKSYVERVCAFNGYPEKRIDSVKTIKKGKAKRLESGNWKVVDNAKIEYTESDTPEWYIALEKERSSQDRQSQIDEVTDNGIRSFGDAEKSADSGDMYLENGEYDKAIDFFTEEIRRDPNNVAAYCGLGKAYRAIGDIEKSFANYNEAILRNPGFAKAYCGRGNTHLGNRDSDNAIADYTEAIRLDPNYAIAYNNRGDTYKDNGEIDNAIADYTEAIRLVPDYAEAYFNRGIAYSEKDDFDEAIADFDKAIKFAPNAAEVYFNRGIVCSEKDDFDNAIADYTEAIRLVPDYAAAYFHRGLLYSKKDDVDKAVADFDETIRIVPDAAEAHFNRGLVYLEKDDFDKAIASFTVAIRYASNDAEVYFKRGLAYIGKNDFDNAIKDFTKTIRFAPSEAAAYYNRGFAYSNKDDLNAAIADYDETIRLVPDNVDAYYNRGNAYFAKENYDNAIKDYNETIRLAPDEAEVYFKRGLVYIDKNDFDNAVKDLTEAIRLAPDEAITYLNRSVAFAEKGEFDNAYADITRALERDPANEDAQRMLLELDAAVQDQRQSEADQEKRLEEDRQKQERLEKASLEGELAWNEGLQQQEAERVEKESRKKKPTAQEPLYPVDKVEEALAQGAACARTGEYDKAIEYFTGAIILATNPAKGYYYRGYAKKGKGDLNGAIEDFSMAVKLDPNFSDAYGAWNDTYNAWSAQNQVQESPEIHYEERTEKKPQRKKTTKKELEPEEQDIYTKPEVKTINIEDLEEFAPPKQHGGLKTFIIIAILATVSWFIYDKCFRNVDHIKIAETYNEKALSLQKSGSSKEAVTAFSKAIKHNPKEPKYYNNRGQLYRAMGHDDGAVSDYGKAIELDPQNVSYYINRADAFRAKKDYDKAISDYTKAIMLDSNNVERYISDNAELYIEKGRMNYDQKKYDNSVSDYMEAIKLRPHDSLFFIRGRILSEIGRYDGVIDNYNEAIGYNPENVEFYINRALAFRAKKDYNGAVSDYTNAIKLSRRETLFFDRGRLFSEMDKLDNAILDYNEAIKLNPRNANYYLSRAQAFRTKKNYYNAVSDYGKAIEISPHDSLFFIRGQLLSDMSRIDDLIANYTQAIEYNPQKADYYLGRAQAFRIKRNYAGAALDYGKVIELSPHDSLFFIRGQLLSGMARIEDAIDNYTAAIRYNPRNALFYGNRGDAYLSVKNYSAAEADYTKVLDLNFNAEFLGKRGLTRHLQDKFVNAIVDFEAALRLNQNEPISKKWLPQAVAAVEKRFIIVINGIGCDAVSVRITAANSSNRVFENYVTVKKGGGRTGKIKIQRAFMNDMEFDVQLMDRSDRIFVKRFLVPLNSDINAVITKEDRKSEGLIADKKKDLVAMWPGKC